MELCSLGFTLEILLHVCKMGVVDFLAREKMFADYAFLQDAVEKRLSLILYSAASVTGLGPRV